MKKKQALPNPVPTLLLVLFIICCSAQNSFSEGSAELKRGPEPEYSEKTQHLEEVLKNMKTHREAWLDLERFDAHFKSIIDFPYTQKLQEDEPVMPDSVQVISLEAYPYYIDAEIALPGSRMLTDDEWRGICNGRMLRLDLEPDMGEVKIRRISPLDEPGKDVSGSDMSDKNIILKFEKALDEAILPPGSRKTIFDRYKPALPLDMEKRLNRWLRVEESPVPVFPSEENIFGDYQRKLLVDTITDYMPVLADEIAALSEAAPANLLELVVIFLRYKTLAEAEPGFWEDGNMLLGARPKEYRPSRHELLLSETGERIKSIVKNAPEKAKILMTERYGNNQPDLRYKRFTVIHLTPWVRAGSSTLTGKSKRTRCMNDEMENPRNFSTNIPDYIMIT